MDRRSVGVVGLGLLGTALAERLLEVGYSVHVCNRTRQKADPLIARGACWSDNPLDVCDRVLISLYTGNTVDEVLRQLDGGLRVGQILIDTTTGDPEETAARGARLARRGIQYLDAPVSGSSEQARRGEVVTIVGGPPQVLEACRDLLDSYSQKTFHVGPCGSAAKMKLVSNLVLGLNRAALAEGLALAQAVGLEPARVLEVLMGSMAYSRTMDTKGHKMVEDDFVPQATLSQHLKDVRLILQTASAAGLALPMSKAHRRLLEAAERLGHGEEDNSAVIRVYEATAPPSPDRTEATTPHFTTRRKSPAREVTSD